MCTSCSKVDVGKFLSKANQLWTLELNCIRKNVQKARLSVCRLRQIELKINAMTSLKPVTSPADTNLTVTCCRKPTRNPWALPTRALPLFM